MDLAAEVSAFKELFDKLQAEEIGIFLSESASRDQMAAALALYLSLSQSKPVKISYPKPVMVPWTHLVGINKVQNSSGGKNFIISLDYVEGSIEKVSYNIEGNKFNLVIEPKSGTHMFSEKNVHYNKSGLNAGMIITVGVAALEMLGKTYTDNKQMFTDKPIIVFDHNPTNRQYGKVNIIRPASSTSEVMAHFLKNAQLPINSDIVTNLYDGVISGSRTFSAPTVTASTFEAAAWLLRTGARKPVNNFVRSEELPRGEFSTSADPEPQLPPDWLKPKIFRGGSGGQNPGGML